MMAISVIVPVNKEARNVPPFVSRVERVMEKMDG